MTDGKMSSMDNPLSRKVDSLVSQMDQFSKQIEQYLGESSVDRDDDDESQDGDSDVCNFKMGLQELLQTSKYAMLRDYQQYGIKWLLSLHTSGLNGIIADEMGLGKTLQVIKFLAALKNQTGKVGPHLMIGPLSVLSNWYHEIEKYAPNEFDVYVHYGSKKEREQSFREVCDDWRRLHRKAVKKSTKISIILTTFNMAINDDSLFRNFTKLCGKSFDYLIVDEAHRIKNQACVLYQQLKLFPVEYRLLLTGTPLQNNLQELWSLLKFLVPKIFPKHEDIQEWFSSYFQVEIDVASNTHSGPSSSATSATKTAVRRGTTATTTTTTPTRGRGHKLFATKLVLPSTSTSSSTSNTRQDHTQLLKSADRDKIIHSLHRVLKPFILRRIKADVAIDIPYKVTKVIKCPLSPLQQELMETLRTFVQERIKQQQQHQQQLQSLTSSNNNKATASQSAADPADTTTTTPTPTPTPTPTMPRYLSALLQDSVHDTAEETGASAAFTLGKTFMTARKLCNHPFLVWDDAATALPPSVGSSSTTTTALSDELYFEHLIAASGKLLVLHHLLRHLLPQGSKVLIFSQFTTTLDILASYFSLVGYGYYRIDGQTDQATRQQYIDAFHGRPMSRRQKQHRDRDMDEDEDEEEEEDDEEEAPVQLFLLTTPSGGVGINLQAANTVILFDQDWNPQQDLQAISRAHRLGQRDPVLVLRLMTSGPDGQTASIEEMMWEKALRKLQANHTILKNGVFASASRGRLMMMSSSTARPTTNSATLMMEGSLTDEDVMNDVEEAGERGGGGRDSDEEEADELTTLDDPLSLTTEDDHQTLTGGGEDHREDAVAQLAETDLPFQWQSLFMHKDAEQSSPTGLPPMGPHLKHQPGHQYQQPQHPLHHQRPPSTLQQLQQQQQQQPRSQPTAATVEAVSITTPSPCCRLRWSMALPASCLEPGAHQASLTSETVPPQHRTVKAANVDASSGGGGGGDVWAAICDRRREQRPPTTTPTTPVTLQDDDFIEITLLPPSPSPSPSSSGSASASASIWSPLSHVFARQLTSYRRYLLPHLTTAPSPVRSPRKSSTATAATKDLDAHGTPSSTAATSSPQRRSSRTHSSNSHFHRFQHAHYEPYTDSPESNQSPDTSNTSPTRRGRRRRRSRSRRSPRSNDGDDSEDVYMSDDHSSHSDVSSPRKRRKGRRTQRGRPRPRPRQRQRRKTAAGDGGDAINDDDGDDSDICVLCHQAALDASDYRALRAAIAEDNTKDGSHGQDQEEDTDFDPALLETLLLCDGCDGAYHLVCVGLTEAPVEDWFCALCESAPLFDAEIPTTTTTTTTAVGADGYVGATATGDGRLEEDEGEEDEIVSADDSDDGEGDEYGEESYRPDEDDDDDNNNVDHPDDDDEDDTEEEQDETADEADW